MVNPIKSGHHPIVGPSSRHLPPVMSASPISRRRECLSLRINKAHKIMQGFPELKMAVMGFVEQKLQIHIPFQALLYVWM